MNEDILIELGDISEETKGIHGGLFETVSPYREPTP